MVKGRLPNLLRTGFQFIWLSRRRNRLNHFPWRQVPYRLVPSEAKAIRLQVGLSGEENQSVPNQGDVRNLGASIREEGGLSRKYL